MERLARLQNRSASTSPLYKQRTCDSLGGVTRVLYPTALLPEAILAPVGNLYGGLIMLCLNSLCATNLNLSPRGDFKWFGSSWVAQSAEL